MRLKNSEHGNAVVIVLVALVVVAVGALAYLSTQKGESGKIETAQAEPAAGQEEKAAAKPETAEAEAPQIEIKPGDPVVGKLGGKDIKRSDVLAYINTMGPQVRQMRIDQLFPLALNQLINSQITQTRSEKAKLDNDPSVKAQVAAAKKNIVRSVFIQKEIQKAMTDEKLQEAYEAYKAAYPKIEERGSRHILVKEEKAAKDLLKQIKDGGDFAALAKEHSVDTTKENGGELGYISKQSPVLPEFLEALFDGKPGELYPKVVKTNAGYHIIEVKDVRDQPPQPFERVKGFLSGQLSNVVLSEIMGEWREQAKVETFDINGEPQNVEPAAGEATEPAAKAEETPVKEEMAKEDAKPAPKAE